MEDEGSVESQMEQLSQALQQVTLSLFPFDSLLKLIVCWCRCSLCASNTDSEKNCGDLLARINALVFEQCNVEVIGWLCCETKSREISGEENP
jgi:hypothetical protein